MSSPLDRVPSASVGIALLAHNADRLLDDLAHLFDKPAWMKDSLCLEHPDVAFFPARGQDTRPAKQICATCLVRDECLTFALDSGEHFGVWGGLSERERKRLHPGRERTPKQSEQVRCSQCEVIPSRLRRGMCPACYARWRRATHTAA